MTGSLLVSGDPMGEAFERSATTGRAHRRPRIVGVATATPPNSYTQLELLDIFQISDDRVRSVFLNSAIVR